MSGPPMDAKDPSETPDRRLLVVAFLGVLSVGVAIGLELFRRLSPGPSSAELPPFERQHRRRSWIPFLPGAGGPQAGGAPEAVGAVPGGAAPSPQRRFQELMRFFSSRADDPVAAQFSKDFMAEPELAHAWERFSRSEDTRALVRDLRRSEAFTRILTRYSVKPEFRAMLEEVAEQPAVAAAVEAEEALDAALERPNQAAAGGPAGAPGGRDPEAPRPGPGPRTAGHRLGPLAAVPQAASAPAAARQGKVFRALERFSPEQLERLREGLKNETLGRSCLNAGVEASVCGMLVRECESAAECRQWLEARGGAPPRGAPAASGAERASFRDFQDPGRRGEPPPSPRPPPPGESRPEGTSPPPSRPRNEPTPTPADVPRPSPSPMPSPAPSPRPG
ncbi:MAG: hypothetical protein HY554_17420 [Elusimicrobia bacterium]|nr:hypothetical protein [Elusimicrobiota bacterium]